MAYSFAPAPLRNRDLLDDLAGLFAGLPMAYRVSAFGSFARGDADRWSDLDLIVVTGSRSQFGDVFTALAARRPIVHRSAFMPNVDPFGGRVLGIVFEGESVFHNLDLNFLTEQEYARPDALHRFGMLKPLYQAADTWAENGVLLPAEAENADDNRISAALHFTKKAIKKIVRGGDTYDELTRNAGWLRQILSEYPADVTVPGGKIGQVAHTYLSAADELLHRQPIKAH